ncbi:zinc finger CCCH domain-containing protein 5-like [Lolium rigidum]|uniref:zinc finger CCCH domain-containing protein 5-like n=1 Tax=Lolium rigidum TaxID=89674 RepID=UPI001F5D5782|nr:zinc finger CCCH domain-containing protein 5-like [Lolium rigidum]
MEPYTAAPPEDAADPDPDTGLEGSMWRLGLGSGGEAPAAAAAAGARLPERPGEANCVYYLRTGACGYGETCRYNHPRDRAAAFDGGARTARTVEYPERPGQPSCEYYMKNGSCKFGSNCKYNHPREGGSVQPVVLNSSGYPLRQGEKECSYYIKTGHCKFGSTCKFHHPQGPEPGVVSEAPNMYPPVQPLPISSSLPYPPLANWQLGRPSVLPGSYFPGSYPPMMHPSAVMPMQGWNPYMSPMNQVASAGGQQTVQAGPLYGLSHQGPPSGVAYGSNYAPLPSSTWPSSNKQEVVFPERPGQPECHHYMKTGTCKFGATCKYNHPQYLSTPRSNYMLSPLGLPIRPGAQPCVYYSQHGFCKYGPGCKFDHPLGALSYSPSASSLGDMPIAPYPSLPAAPMAPSPSSSVPRPEYILGKDSSAYQPASPGTTFGPSGPMSKVYAPHMLLRPPTSTTGATVTSHGGEL